jgi:hypothetical protein
MRSCSNNVLLIHFVGGIKFFKFLNFFFFCSGLWVIYGSE